MLRHWATFAALTAVLAPTFPVQGQDVLDCSVPGGVEMVTVVLDNGGGGRLCLVAADFLYWHKIWQTLKGAGFCYGVLSLYAHKHI
jgi:hypothetical protein